LSKKKSIQKIATLTGHNASIFSIIPYKAPHLFLSGAGEGWIVEWDFNCYLEKENVVVAGNMNGGVHWVDLDNPTETKNILQHQKGVFAIQQVDNELFTAGGAGLLTRWNIKRQKTIESLHLSNQYFSNKTND